VGDGPAGELCRVGHVEGDVEGRGEGDGGSTDGGDLHHLPDRTIVPGEPATGGPARLGGRIGAPVDVGIVGDLVHQDHLPDGAAVDRGLDARGRVHRAVPVVGGVDGGAHGRVVGDAARDSRVPVGETLWRHDVGGGQPRVGQEAE